MDTTNDSRVTILPGYLVYSSDGAYIGRAKYKITVGNPPGSEMVLTIVPISRLGADLLISSLLVRSVEHTTPGRVVIEPSWAQVVLVASRRQADLDRGVEGVLCHDRSL